MVVILADDNFKCILLNANDLIPIRISGELWVSIVSYLEESDREISGSL